jgi:hypothetical protein
MAYLMYTIDFLAIRNMAFALLSNNQYSCFSELKTP